MANTGQLLSSPRPFPNLCFLLYKMGLSGNIQAQGPATWGSTAALATQHKDFFALNQSNIDL